MTFTQRIPRASKKKFLHLQMMFQRTEVSFLQAMASAFSVKVNVMTALAQTVRITPSEASGFIPVGEGRLTISLTL